jgi:hypothetical protein
MKTHDLISLLSQDAALAPSPSGAQKMTAAVLLATVTSSVLLFWFWGINKHLLEQMPSTVMLIKLIWLVVLCGFAWRVMLRLSQPGLSFGLGVWGLLAAWMTMVFLAIDQWQQAAVFEKSSLLWGTTWQVCSVSIAALAVPFLFASIWTLRDTAPTRPAWAGAAAGLVSGLLSALVYSLHCPETAYPFLLLWYVAGIAAMCGVGAVAGRYWLRW